jgi:hypothetical protein
MLQLKDLLLSNGISLVLAYTTVNGLLPRLRFAMADRPDVKIRNFSGAGPQQILFY